MYVKVEIEFFIVIKNFFENIVNVGVFIIIIV